MKPSIRNAGVAVLAAAVVLGGAVAAVSLTSPGTHPAASRAAGVARTRLAASTCSGPAGAAYVSDAGFDGFTAVDTANCKVIQTYNVGDYPVPGFAKAFDFSSTPEGIAVRGHTLYFADTGDSAVAVINAAALNPKNDSPAETNINVGLFPQELAVTPDGKQLWVAETGVQTSSGAPSRVSVIDTADNKVIAHLSLGGSPTQVAFSPDGKTAYIVTSEGLWAYSTGNLAEIGETTGLGDPRAVAVSPDGKTLYVTDTVHNAVKVLSAATGQVTGTIGVGDLPWQDVISANGKTLYVANPDSDSVSVIDTARNTVTDTISIPGDPGILALTPNGKQLWVGQIAMAYVQVIDTSDDSLVGDVNLGGSVAHSGDGYGPNGIALVSTPTPGS